jgi:hypothetical protein
MNEELRIERPLREGEGESLPAVRPSVAQELARVSPVLDEDDERARLLDPIVAEQREALRMELAGPRRGSFLPPNWEPVDQPWVGGTLTSRTDGPLAPSAERHAAIVAHLERTGMGVPHKAANIREDGHIIAAPAPVVRARRFAPGGIPGGVNQHLPCTIEADDRDARCETCRAIDQNTGAIL